MSDLSGNQICPFCGHVLIYVFLPGKGRDTNTSIETKVFWEFDNSNVFSRAEGISFEVGV